METKKSNGGHNKKSLSTEQIRQLEKLSQVLSKKFIADLFGISRPTFDKILAENPKLLLLYKKGKAKTMQKAGITLLQKAFGDPENEIPPDTACLLFFLKTQGEGDYREIKEVAIEHSAVITSQKQLEELTDDELANIATNGG